MCHLLMFNQAAEKWKDRLPNKTTGNGKCRKMKKDEKSEKGEEKMRKDVKYVQIFPWK